VPGPWSDDDEPFDGPFDEPPGAGAPLHPDDRLWRHPSELAWERAEAVRRASLVPPPPPSPGPGRLLLVTVTSGVVGAAMALGVLAANGALEEGGGERIVERVGVRDVLADPLAPEPDLGLADVIASASPSVVAVQSDAAGEAAGGGSGIVLLDDGHIATAAALVGDAAEVRVVLADGTTVVAEVVEVDEITDIAIIAAAGPAGEHDWVPALRGEAAALRVGEATVAVGAADRPGADPIIALGMVSGLDRMARSSAGWTLTDLVETDMDLRARVVGGALVDRAGRVVGMVTSVGDDADRVGLSTPIERAWATLEAALDDDRTEVWLGIEGSDHDLPATSLPQLVASRAVRVHAVTEGGPADAAGLLPGDLLVTLDGEPIDSMGDLVVRLRGHRPGDLVTLGVLRDGEPIEVGVALGAAGE
jgi:S1-C subfamily serine protease